ncbi:unnamed protein product [Rotaria socialis]|uniref:Uncharacterized protein n=3 Tax=Rotaria socialis TaxID=392032 RepID=A0A817V184_9BILA|nr:unnamed protein product [Rotaria socialis]CAF3585571.1 unnamed protein product [Rotaria socialis]CAF3644952.1 unnamed protein product [Rotaria socialis]CAF3690333.1 unnamed protein product [Rotaria socialis]CAF3751332.1 unnamed protein product [Rotaria socialis]
MTSSIDNNRCKLLVLDLDINKITIEALRTFFLSYGPVEWIETFAESNSAIIYFVSYLIVDRLISLRTCVIDQNTVRLRRCRLDQTNWYIDSQTLLIKLTPSTYSNSILTESTLRYCFRDYQLHIIKIDIINENQALICLSHYDYVDQVILMPSNTFIYDGVPLVFERMMEKRNPKSRWDQVVVPLTTKPILADRDPVVYKLLTHIEYLAKQLRGQPNQARNKIEQLEAEVFILKNENARLKSKHELSSNKNLEQRLIALEDVSNKFASKRFTNNRRERSHSIEKQSKRLRRFKIDDDICDSS